MRILIIQPWIRMGEPEVVSVHLARELQSRGHKIGIGCTFLDWQGMPPQARDLRYLLPNQILAGLCRRSRLFFLMLGPWPLLASVWRHARDADVLNPHNFPACWVAVVVAAARGIPVVWTCNEPPPRGPWGEAPKVGLGDYLGWLLASSRLDQLLVGRVAEIHVPSEITKAQVMKRYGREAKVVPFGVDADFYGHANPGVAVAKYGLGGNFVLVTVGKLHPQKNQILCLKALAEVRPTIPNAVLLVIGDGPMAQQWRRLARELGLAHQVRFLGRASSEEVRDLYAAAAINLFPAINQSWELTPFEALCAQTVSTVSNESGAAEVLAPEGIGVVCEPTAEDFAEQIGKVHGHPALYKEMAARGRAYVRHHLTWGRYAESVLKLMESALSQAAAGPAVAGEASRA